MYAVEGNGVCRGREREYLQGAEEFDKMRAIALRKIFKNISSNYNNEKSIPIENEI